MAKSFRDGLIGKTGGISDKLLSEEDRDEVNDQLFTILMYYHCAVSIVDKNVFENSRG